MILVVGLGNPGKEYSSSKHNIGFMVVDELADRLKVSSWKKGFKSLYAETVLQEKRLMLLKPQTYMNLSGDAVSEAAGFFKIPLEDVITVYDEMDISLGGVKIKIGGGSAGHKGVQSMIGNLGGDNFIRVRVGIGKPSYKSETTSHVLTGFRKEEKQLIADAVIRAADAISEIIVSGVNTAMNKFNKKLETQSDQTDSK